MTQTYSGEIRVVDDHTPLETEMTLTASLDGAGRGGATLIVPRGTELPRPGDRVSITISPNLPEPTRSGS